jgi:hypothetical protein
VGEGNFLVVVHRVIDNAPHHSDFAVGVVASEADESLLLEVSFVFNAH